MEVPCRDKPPDPKGVLFVVLGPGVGAKVGPNAQAKWGVHVTELNARHTIHAPSTPPQLILSLDTLSTPIEACNKPRGSIRV